MSAPPRLIKIEEHSGQTGGGVVVRVVEVDQNSVVPKIEGRERTYQEWSDEGRGDCGGWEGGGGGAGVGLISLGSNQSF